MVVAAPAALLLPATIVATKALVVTEATVGRCAVALSTRTSQTVATTRAGLIAVEAVTLEMAGVGTIAAHALLRRLGRGETRCRWGVVRGRTRARGSSQGRTRAAGSLRFAVRLQVIVASPGGRGLRCRVSKGLTSLRVGRTTTEGIVNTSKSATDAALCSRLGSSGAAVVVNTRAQGSVPSS